MDRSRKVITCDKWWSLVNVNCQTLSANYWPIREAEVHEYTCKAADFLKESKYLVRYTNRDGSKIVDWNNPEARPITIQDFIKNQSFVNELLVNWYHHTPIHSAQLLIHSCTTCHRSIVIDGVHRIVSIAVNNFSEIDLHITELAGAEWPSGMPDMGLICDCKSTLV